MPEKLKPVIVPEGIKAYVTKVCTYFSLPDDVFQAAFVHLNNYGDSHYYSDKDPKCIAAALMSVITEEGEKLNWRKCRRVKNKDLAECLGISSWSVSKHRQMYKRFLADKVRGIR